MLEFHRAGIRSVFGRADDRGDRQRGARRIRNKGRFDAPVPVRRPIIKPLELYARRGIGMFHAQRAVASALDHREFSFALVEAQHARRPLAVVLQLDAAPERLAVQRQRQSAIGCEKHLAALALEHAQRLRPHCHADAAARTAADIVRFKRQPVQTDQTGPTIRLGQVFLALDTPEIFFGQILRLRHAERCILGGFLLAAGRDHRQRQRQHCNAAQRDSSPHRRGAFPILNLAHVNPVHVQRPLKNQRSISPSVNFAQVGRP